MLKVKENITEDELLEMGFCTGEYEALMEKIIWRSEFSQEDYISLVVDTFTGEISVKTSCVKFTGLESDTSALDVIFDMMEKGILEKY